LSLAHGLLWVLGLAEIALGARRLRQQMVKRESAEKELLCLSITDPLTGLHNRRGFQGAGRSRPAVGSVRSSALKTQVKIGKPRSKDGTRDHRRVVLMKQGRGWAVGGADNVYRLSVSFPAFGDACLSPPCSGV